MSIINVEQYSKEPMKGLDEGFDRLGFSGDALPIGTYTGVLGDLKKVVIRSGVSQTEDGPRPWAFVDKIYFIVIGGEHAGRAFFPNSLDGRTSVFFQGLVAAALTKIERKQFRGPADWSEQSVAEALNHIYSGAVEFRFRAGRYGFDNVAKIERLAKLTGFSIEELTGPNARENKEGIKNEFWQEAKDYARVFKNSTEWRAAAGNELEVQSPLANDGETRLIQAQNYLSSFVQKRQTIVQEALGVTPAEETEDALITDDDVPF